MSQQYENSATVAKSFWPKSNYQQSPFAGNMEGLSDKKPASSDSNLERSQRKKSLCNLGLIWKKNRSDDGSDFRLKNILLRGHTIGENPLRPVCYSCYKPYNNDLMYIHCGVCQEWYHADAVKLDESELSNLIGFKCCRCRRIRSPVCPYASSKLSKIGVKVGNPIDEKTSNKKMKMNDETNVIVGKAVMKENCAKSFDVIELQSSQDTTDLEEKGDCDIETMEDNEQYVNKNIKMYSDTVVVGKDVDRGNYVTSFYDVELRSHENATNREEKGDCDCDSETLKDNDTRSTSSSSLPLESKEVRKRDREYDSALEKISTQLREIAMILERFSKSQLDVYRLYEEIMKTQGFEEELLVSVFDYLVEHENQAKGFLAKSDKLRKFWLQQFKENNC